MKSQTTNNQLTLTKRDEIFELLSSLPDPEIPVITIEDLGILRDVLFDENTCTIVITPTYTGCPAMKMIEHDILATLKSKGIENAKVELVYTPAWTTDWLTDDAKEKLRKFGIAPPEKTSSDKSELLGKKKIIQPEQTESTTASN